MPREMAFGLADLEDLIRSTAPPAGVAEICDQGLKLIAGALGARGGVLLLRVLPDASPTVMASCGQGVTEGLIRAGTKALEDAVSIGVVDAVEDLGRSAPVPGALVVVIPGEAGPVGAIVLDRPQGKPDTAQRFAQAASQAVGASLGAARQIEAGRQQGELLSRRNAELEALREIAGSLQGLPTEDAILQAALDLVLQKMGLEAGWIFWGERSQGLLELAASRGVDPGFVRRAREEGIGSCLCLDVFSAGGLHLARNTIECPRLPELVDGCAQTTHACIPLKFDRGVLGVLNIANRPGQVFSQQELRFLETVGTQVCLAVDKTRTTRGEARRNAEARALVALAGAIGGSLDQQRVLATVGDYVRQLLAVDRCAILLGGDPASLSLEYLSGPPMEGLEIGRAADLGAAGSRLLPEAMRARQTVVIYDASTDPRSNPERARRWAIGSAILVPLEAHGRIAGLLVASRERTSSWSPEEVELANALAGQAAVAIENARLYREAQEAFLDLQKAQYGMMRAERLAAVGTLASSLAHEVRNPLNSINLQLVLLTRRLSRLEPRAHAELAPFVDTVRREIERLNGLVEEFLSLSTIDRLSRRETEPVEVVREMLALMVPMAVSRGVSVSEILPEPLPRLPLDREKIKQVLINLVRNAIEAMPQGGNLTISARREETGIVIGVADTGVGIEPGIDVFDFFTSTKRGGTGLGLPIARRIVEAHGGRLTYDSTPGRGTTFWIALKGELQPERASGTEGP